MINEYANYIDEFRITVMDLLGEEELKIFTKIHNVTPHGSNFLISSIVCPYCKRTVVINKHWNCFICTDKEHGKKVFEILAVEVPDVIQEIV